MAGGCFAGKEVFPTYFHYKFCASHRDMPRRTRSHGTHNGNPFPPCTRPSVPPLKIFFGPYHGLPSHSTVRFSRPRKLTMYLLISSFVKLAQAFVAAALSSSSVSGPKAAMRRCSEAHRCSMGFRCGLYGGQLITATFSRASAVSVFEAVWGRALSCIRRPFFILRTRLAAMGRRCLV